MKRSTRKSARTPRYPYAIERLEDRTLLAVIASNTTVSGTIGFAAETDLFTFNATAGQRIVFTMSDVSASGALSPAVSITGPGSSTVVGSASGTGEAFVEFTAATSGTFTASARGAGNTTGAYKVRLVNMTTAVNADPHDGHGGLIATGTTKAGSINDFGDIDTFRFTANAGQRVVLTLSDLSAGGTADGSFYPYFAVYGPNGAIIDGDQSPTDPYIEFAAPSSGTFNVLVAGAGDTVGAYKLRLAVAGQTTVNVDPDDNQGGTIATGTTKSASINDWGDIDVYKFTANAGQRVVLSLSDLSSGGTTDGSFYPYFTAYGPNGAIISADQSPTDPFIEFSAAATGSYTVVVTGSGATFGAYKLRLAVAGQTTVNADPNDNHGGTIASGTTKFASINDWGDIDVYRFTANVGQRVVLSLSDLSSGGTSDGGLYPYVAVYGPNGALIDAEQSPTDPYIEFSAAATGSYNIVVTGAGATVGAYKLRLAVAGQTTVNTDPDDGHGGALASATTRSASINDWGDIDVYRFTANSGQRVVLTVSDTSAGGTTDGGFYPYFTVYGPDGAIITAEQSPTDPFIEFAAAATGSYNVVVTGSGATLGAYRLRLNTMGTTSVAADPFDSHGGPLSHHTTKSAGIGDFGDTDLYSFTANTGQRIVLTLTDTSASNGTADGGFYPYIAVYGPNGALIDADQNPTDAYIEFSAGATGTFNVLVAGAGNSIGSYKLRYAKFGMTSSTTDSSDSHGGFLASGVTRTASINDYGDLDVYGFYAAPGDILQLTMSDTGSLYNYFTLYSPTGSVINASSGSTSAVINHTVTTAGLYGLVTTSSGASLGSYSVKLNLTPNYTSAKSTISLSVIDPLATEPGSDTAVIRFTRTNNRATPQVVNYLIGGVATNGTDYDTLTGQITIQPNSSFADLIVKPKSDTATEGTESVVVTLKTGANYLVTSDATKKTATVNIASSGTGKISGTVFNDIDNDGVKDSNEAGLVGRRVFVDSDKDGVWDNNERSVLTTTGGAYAFTNLPAATFRVRQVLASGEKTTTPTSGNHEFVLAAAQNVTGKNFGAAVPKPVTARVNATASTITIGDGRTFAAAGGFTSGTERTTAFAVGNTTDDSLYYTMRVGADFSFARSVPKGSYSIQLFFAEPTSTATGQRKFDVFAEGSKVISDLDLVAAAGSKNAYARVIPVTITDGQLNLRFLGKVGSAILSAIVIAPRYEAESAVRTGAIVGSANAGFTGTGYVDFTASGQTLTFTAITASAGKFSLKFRYANGGTTNLPLKLEVNGVVKSAALAFNSTGSWTTYKEVNITVDLVKGANTVKLTSAGNGVNLDSLALV
jgi:hypothetical protein